MALTVVLATVAALIVLSALALLTTGRALGRPLIYGGSLALCGIGLVAGLIALLGQAPTETSILPIGLPWLGAHFRLDALSAFFLVVINLGGGAASLYAIGFGRHETAPQRVLPFYPLFLAAMPLTAIAKTGRKAESHRPFPRAIVGSDGWQLALRELVEATATLLGLWGDRDAVHLALLEELSGAIAVFTLPCPDGKFPSVGAHHPAAIRLERTILDLYGLKPVGASDARHWLDLGFWGVTHPLGKRRKRAIEAYPYEFLPVEGEDLHQIPVGPVHAQGGENDDADGQAKGPPPQGSALNGRFGLHWPQQTRKSHDQSYRWGTTP